MSSNNDKPKTKTAKAFLSWVAKQDPVNATKLASNENKRILRKGTVDAEQEQQKAKKAKKAAAEAAAGALHDKWTGEVVDLLMEDD